MVRPKNRILVVSSFAHGACLMRKIVSSIADPLPRGAIGMGRRLRAFEIRDDIA